MTGRESLLEARDVRMLAAEAKAVNEGPARRPSGGYVPNSADSEFRDALSPDTVLALCDALEAAEAYLFEPRRPGDIKPYRRVQEAFAALGLRSSVDV